MPYYRCPACGLVSYSGTGHATAAVCVHCSVALPEQAKVYPLPDTDGGIRRILLARPEAVAEARRAVRDAALPEAAGATLALLVSELVTNAIRHAGIGNEDAIGLHITNHAGHVRLAVHDGGRGFTRHSLHNGGPAPAGGQGLVLVDALSDAWGVEQNGDGCVVWCELGVNGMATNGHAPDGVGSREAT